MPKPLLPLALAASLLACDNSADARKDEARRRRDAQLLALPYPSAQGDLPASITLLYDPARDRTTMTLRLTALQLSGPAAANAAQPQLHLSSVHRGRARPADDPEGYIDAAFLITTTRPGLLAYAGSPGSLHADAETRPLQEATNADPYSSAPAPGREETVRFRIPTEDLVNAANAAAVSLSLGPLRVELDPQARHDLRHFASRLRPGRKTLPRRQPRAPESPPPPRTSPPPPRRS